MAKQRFKGNLTKLTPILENKTIESKAVNLKEYHVKISMIKPYKVVDFWVRKPDENNALQLFMDELPTLNPSEYFKIEVSEV